MIEKVSLKQYRPNKRIRTRNILIESLWGFVSFLMIENPLCVCSFLKIFVLKIFGTTIGQGVVIKPCVKIKYPWKLRIGDYSWIGENVWIDNIVDVTIGKDVCLSQGVYLCTGNHDWSRVDFSLITKEIIIEDGVWVGAKAIVSAGVCLATHCVITLGSVVVSSTQPYQIYQGNPAVYIKQRTIHS